jgi:hypothetical protein
MLEHFPRDLSGDLHDRLIARAAFRNVSLSTSSAEFKSSQMAKSREQRKGNRIIRVFGRGGGDRNCIPNL